MSAEQNNNTIKRIINNLNKLNLNFKLSLGSEGIFILVLGLSFITLSSILSFFVKGTYIPNYWLIGWFIITLVVTFLFHKYKSIREDNAQLVLLFFGIALMATTVLLKYLNNFSDHFIFFYWLMAVSVSLGISNLRFMIQIWLIPLFFVLFATVFVDIPEADKMQFYIWNPVITIMSFFGVYSSMRAKKDLIDYKEQAKKYKFEFENLMDTMSNTLIIKDEKNKILKVNKQHAKLNNKRISDFDDKQQFSV